MLSQAFVAGLTLACAAIAHPAAHKEQRRDADSIPDMTLYDASIAQPTLLVDQPVVFMAVDGQNAVTKVEDVLVVPTGDAKITITTMIAQKTTTLTVAKPAATANKAADQLGPVIPSSIPAVAEGSALHGVAPNAGGLPGISYAPYKSTHDCKSQDDILNDFERFAKDYSMVRVYGTDCDQVGKVHAAAQKHDINLFLGIWDMNMVEQECQEIIRGVNGDWGRVNTVSVGNELVNKGQASAAQVVSAVGQARSILRQAGYQGPVVAVDTFSAVEANPELCEASDYCAFNAHAFFDGMTQAHEAGTWLRNTVDRIQGRLSDPNKKVVVTETGWPTQGVANNMAVPGLEYQRSAIASIKEAFSQSPSSVILFSAFNDLWKQNDAATFNAEQYWGIDGAVSSSDGQAGAGNNYWA